LAVTERVWPVATKPDNNESDFLLPFFQITPASLAAAGRAYRDRLHQRQGAHVRPVKAVACVQQVAGAERPCR